MNKEEWLRSTALKEYLQYKDTTLYGVAYGIDPNELKHARDTIDLVEEQWKDIIKYYELHVDNFIHDMKNFEKNKNTIKNVYF